MSWILYTLIFIIELFVIVFFITTAMKFSKEINAKKINI